MKQRIMVRENNLQMMTRQTPIISYPAYSKINSNKIQVMTKVDKKSIIPIDDWIPEPKDLLFTQIDNFIIAPVSKYFKESNQAMDYFSLRSKKVYNKPQVRTLCVRTLNYFEKFYDTGKELFGAYSKLKSMIDISGQEYTRELFYQDLKKYIIYEPTLSLKMDYMNYDNFKPVKTKFSGTDMCLYYNNKHICIMMRISLTMKLIIPLLTHYAYKKRVTDIDEFLITIFRDIIKYYQSDVDLYAKFWETCSTNINKNKNHNSIWNNQDIRGINTTSHTIFSIDNIVLNIMPKYIYSDNPVTLNYASIGQGIKYKITDIGYDKAYTSLSSSMRDESEASEMDKFESYLSKSDESLFIQNKVNAEYTMKSIKAMFGPFDEDEIRYYNTKLIGNSNSSIIHPFQKELIYNIFYKYFGDVLSPNGITNIDYIILMIAVKKICTNVNMKLFPYVVSSRVVKYTKKKSLNKKEADKVVASPYYEEFRRIYHDSEKAKKKLNEIIATILSSDFEIIDYPKNYTKENESQCVDGLMLPKLPDIMIDEVLRYTIMIP